jgi:hypothetical protein
MSDATPVGRRQLQRISDELSERDRALLTSVGTLRYVTARQLEALHFANHATPISGARSCRRVLERLTGLRVIERIERRVGGVRAGSSSWVYRTGPVGERLTQDGRRRRREPSPAFLNHTLAVAQVAVDLRIAERAERCEIDQLEVEPACWRTVRAGIAGTETLRPDLAVVLGVGDYEHRWFIEVDLDTEHLPAVLRKCRLYDRYYRSGDEQHAHGIFPKVAWAVPDKRRVERIETAINRQRDLTADLFVITTRDRLTDVLCGGIR